MREIWRLIRPTLCMLFPAYIQRPKKGQKRPIFPVKRGVFSLLYHDFKVQLIMRKMPIGLCKIPPCITDPFPEN